MLLFKMKNQPSPTTMVHQTTKAKSFNYSIAMALVCAIIFFGTGNRANAQTFNCYISNDHLVSPTVFEFDVSISNTSGTDFLFRTAQLCFTFNAAFTNGATITTTYVGGSTQMINYTPGSITYSVAASGFQVAANTGVACVNGTIIPASGVAIRIATFHFVIAILNAKPDGAGTSPVIAMFGLLAAQPNWPAIAVMRNVAMRLTAPEAGIMVPLTHATPVLAAT